jgi:hypothetical protein
MKWDNKIFWKYIQSKTKENIPCIMDENGEIHTDDKKKAELLNNFFKSVFTNEDSTQGIPPIVRDGPFNLKGRVMVFFLKKNYSDSQCC